LETNRFVNIQRLPIILEKTNFAPLEMAFEKCIENEKIRKIILKPYYLKKVIPWLKSKALESIVRQTKNLSILKSFLKQANKINLDLIALNREKRIKILHSCDKVFFNFLFSKFISKP